MITVRGVSVRARRAVALVGVIALIAACSSPPPALDAGDSGGVDVAADQGAPADARPVDAAPGDVAPCLNDVACSDGLYCNGAERCAPGTAGADARGCVAGTPPCAGDAGTRCDEAMEQCVSTDCADPDHDHDGENKPGCGGNDCNDNDATVHHGAAEVCDGAGHDEDCDPCTVASRPSAGSPTDGDTDADGFISTACTNAYVGNAPTTCDPVAVRVGGGLVTGSDCAPDDPNRRPNQVEACNHVDDNCNGQTDEGITPSSYYPDTDGDGAGAAGATAVVDCAPPAGYVANARDCNDSDGTIYPGAPEGCDGIDSDCSLAVGAGGPDPAEDADGDGHSSTAAGCVGGLFPRDDCNDANPAVYRGATEVCDRIDDDCSLAAGAGGVDPAEDQDDDGHAAPTATCAGGPIPKDDCNDNNASVHPGATEQCDRVDSDCSAGGGVAIDEDADDDGYAPIGAGCVGGPRPPTDCDDGTATVHPNATEVCDGLDQDCNGTVDDQTPGTWICASSRLACFQRQCVGANRVASGPAASHTLALPQPQATYAWGSNSAGQLGDSGFSFGGPGMLMWYVDPPNEFAAGADHSCTVAPAYLPPTVSCWGGNQYGQLGDATQTAHTAITAVSGITGLIEVAAGNQFTCARHNTGSVYCWGNNTYGQLGNNSTTLRTAPTQVRNLTDAVEIAVGYTHACARRASGAVMCWGNNTNGQIGDGTFGNSRLVPTAVSGLTDAVEIAAGGMFTCARRAAGPVVCWGSNNFGQLGNGIMLDSQTAVPVMNLTNVAEIDLGYAHACARQFSGAVSCWGYNGHGELGDGTTASKSTPTPVSGLTDAAEVALGYAHGCAWRATGSYVCWGRDDLSQVGDGGGANHLTPFPVPGI